MNRFQVTENTISSSTGLHSSQSYSSTDSKRDASSVKISNLPGDKSSEIDRSADMVAYDTYRKAHYRSTMPDTRILVFLTGFCIGMVFFYISKRDNSCPFDQEQLIWMQGLDIYQAGLLKYIFGRRMKQFAFLIICALSSIGNVLAYLIMGWYGFEIGVLIFSLLYQYGMKGIFLTLCMFLPQGVFYTAAFLLIFHQYWSGDRKSCHNEEKIMEKGFLAKIGSLKKPVVILFLFILGMLCEAYVNPSIMKKMALFF